VVQRIVTSLVQFFLESVTSREVVKNSGGV